MINVGEVIQRIQSLYSKGVQSDDTRLSDRHIYSKILTVRARLFKEKANKKQPISEFNYQTICVPVHLMTEYSIPCDCPGGCPVLETVNPIPKPIDSIFNDLFYRVSTLDSGIFFEKIEVQNLRWMSGSKYGAKKPRYTVINSDMIRLFNITPGLGYILITGMFEDPIEAYLYGNECCCKEERECMAYTDVPFFIDMSSLDSLVELCVAELIEIFSKTKEDKVNNTEEDE
jgi:hypothetical protein